MKKRRHHERVDAPKPSSQRGNEIVDGDTLPEAVKRAIAEAGKGTALCKITHKDTEVALISAKWIPLIIRLEKANFTRRELAALDWSVFDEDRTPEKRSQEIVAWAKSLGKR